jgi:hypothetical protein
VGADLLAAGGQGKAGGAAEGEDWLLLARPMFVLLRKVADMEVEEGSYKLSLLLSVLLQLLSLVPDSKLWQLETGQLDPELLVHCIRTSPSSDTRQTALHVLARCAVSNPDFIQQNSITIFTFMGSQCSRLTPSKVSRLPFRHWR